MAKLFFEKYCGKIKKYKGKIGDKKYIVSICFYFLDDVALRALILKHLVRGTLERKDLNGQVQTLAGVPITLTKNDKGKLIIISNGKTTKLKITNVRTKWGIVHVIDSVLA